MNTRRLAFALLLIGALSAPPSPPEAVAQAQFNTLFDRQMELTPFAESTWTTDSFEVDPVDITKGIESNIITISGATMRSFLQTQDRTTPVNVVTGDFIGARLGLNPISYVAAASMVDADGSTTSFDDPSPAALISSRFLGLVVTSAEALTLNSGNLTDTLTVDAIDRDLPYGFVLQFGSEYCALNAAATSGATTLSIRKIWNDCAIADNEEAVPGNRFYNQEGVLSVTLRDLVLMADPSTMMASTDPWTNETAREYGLDAVVVDGLGWTLENITIDNFPGHGIFVMNMGANATRAGTFTPWEREDTNIKSFSISRCLAGLTVEAGDVYIGDGAVHTVRDAGFHALGVCEFDKLHLYGCGIGAEIESFVRGQYLETEFCQNAGDVLAGASHTQITQWRAYGNTGRCVRWFTDNGWVGKFHLDHAVTDQPTLLVGQFADHTVFDKVYIDAAGEADGITIGDGTSEILDNFQMDATVLTAGGTFGTRFVCDMAHCDIKIHSDGDSDDSGPDQGDVLFESTCQAEGCSFEIWLPTDGSFWMEDSSDMTGCTLIIRGDGDAIVRWPGQTGTGTLTDPDLDETTQDDDNTIIILPY